MKAQANLKWGKREVMLVAWWLKKRYEPNRSEPYYYSLREAWERLKTNIKSFEEYLKAAIKAKRVKSLENWDLMKTIACASDGAHTQVNFTGWFWDKKYDKVKEVQILTETEKAVMREGKKRYGLYQEYTDEQLGSDYGKSLKDVSGNVKNERFCE